MTKGIIFDKDGTLFDFNATWGAWAGLLITREAQGDQDRIDALSDVMGYDMQTRQFLPGSVVIAETVAVTADHILRALPGVSREDLLTRMYDAASSVAQVQVVPLVPLFDDLRGRGLRLGVATNDAETPALQNLESAQIRDHFDFIAGYDSGHGAKPGPGQLLAFCAHTGLNPGDCIMVGDSTHDLLAGQAAGMRTIGVLTGPALADELAPLADAVLPTIGDIPAWLEQ